MVVWYRGGSRKNASERKRRRGEHRRRSKYLQERSWIVAREGVGREWIHGWIGVLEHVYKARLKKALRRIEVSTC
jgi:hypothetical protein